MIFSIEGNSSSPRLLSSFVAGLEFPNWSLYSLVRIPPALKFCRSLKISLKNASIDSIYFTKASLPSLPWNGLEVSIGIELLSIGTRFVTDKLAVALELRNNSSAFFPSCRFCYKMDTCDSSMKFLGFPGFGQMEGILSGLFNKISMPMILPITYIGCSLVSESFTVLPFTLLGLKNSLFVWKLLGSKLASTVSDVSLRIA